MPHLSFIADTLELCVVGLRHLQPSDGAEVGKGFMLKWKTLSISLSSEVALRVVPDRIEHERFAEEHLDFVVRPILCRQRLQEHNDALVGLERRAAT